MMITRDQWPAFIDHPAPRMDDLRSLGVLLMILSPLAGVPPGPGGICSSSRGLALVLKTSMWAKRRYVRFKRWQPKAGRWFDWGLRRERAAPRALRKERAELRRRRRSASADDPLPKPGLEWPPDPTRATEVAAAIEGGGD
jgi:hypothetical protein